MNKTLLALAMATIATLAHGECYNRTATLAASNAKIDRIADIQRYVAPEAHGQFRCRVTFRAQFGSEWRTGEGVAHGFDGDNQDQICAQAMTTGQSYLLQKIGGSSVSADSEVICTDAPLPKIRKVQVGETVRESEVNPHPRYNKPFVYRNTQCRWFIETEAMGPDLYQWQGVICRAQKDFWQVVDKF